MICAAGMSRSAAIEGAPSSVTSFLPPSSTEARLGVGPAVPNICAAFDDRAAKQSLRERGCHGIADVCSPGRLAKDRDPLGVTAKRGDIRLDPAQRGLLVQQAIIAGDMVGTFRVQLGVCKETERDQAGS